MLLVLLRNQLTPRRCYGWLSDCIRLGLSLGLCRGWFTNGCGYEDQHFGQLDHEELGIQGNSMNEAQPDSEERHPIGVRPRSNSKEDSLRVEVLVTVAGVARTVIMDQRTEVNVTGSSVTVSVEPGRFLVTVVVTVEVEVTVKVVRVLRSRLNS